MYRHYISDELYGEMRLLPTEILKRSALEMRKQWIKNPNDDTSLGLLLFAEVLAERNIHMPEIRETEAAIIRKAVLNK